MNRLYYSKIPSWQKWIETSIALGYASTHSWESSVVLIFVAMQQFDASSNKMSQQYANSLAKYSFAWTRSWIRFSNQYLNFVCVEWMAQKKSDRNERISCIESMINAIIHWNWFQNKNRVNWLIEICINSTDNESMSVIQQNNVFRSREQQHSTFWIRWIECIIHVDQIISINWWHYDKFCAVIQSSQCITFGISN